MTVFLPGPINALNAVQGVGGEVHAAHLEGEALVSGFVGERDEVLRRQLWMVVVVARKRRSSSARLAWKHGGIAAGDWARVHGWACEAGEGRGSGSGYLASSFWLPARVYLHDAPQGRRRVVPRRRRAPATGTRVAASTRWNGVRRRRSCQLQRDTLRASPLAPRHRHLRVPLRAPAFPRPAAEGPGTHLRSTHCYGLSVQVPYFAVREYAPHLTTEWARASQFFPGNTIPPWSPVEESPSQRELALLGGSWTVEKRTQTGDSSGPSIDQRKQTRKKNVARRREGRREGG
ncbi:hypothetical protein B0H14DRAFT_2629238 [Mycena olivaceomarginata]|nr:hypothetical protein B0H14DRAFT_2629238 [Mycena olivaceomarginata]